MPIADSISRLGSSSSQEEVDSCVTIEFPCASIVELGITSMSFHLIGEMEQHFCTTFRFSNSHFECPLTLPHPSYFSPPCVEIPYQWLLPSESPGSGSSTVMDDTSRTDEMTRTSPKNVVLHHYCIIFLHSFCHFPRFLAFVHPTTTSPSRPCHAQWPRSCPPRWPNSPGRPVQMLGCLDDSDASEDPPRPRRWTLGWSRLMAAG